MELDGGYTEAQRIHAIPDYYGAPGTHYGVYNKSSWAVHCSMLETIHCVSIACVEFALHVKANYAYLGLLI